MELLIFLGALFFFMCFGVPLAIVLVLCSIVLMWHSGMWDPMIIPNTMLDGTNNYPLMAIPFFVFAGEIMAAGGLSHRVVALAQLMVGRIRGGKIHETGLYRASRPPFQQLGPGGLQLGLPVAHEDQVTAPVRQLAGEFQPHARASARDQRDHLASSFSISFRRLFGSPSTQRLHFISSVYIRPMQ